MNKTIVIEIESNEGNTIGSVLLDLEKLFEIKSSGCSVADVDEDYIYRTESQLVRIQLDQ